MNDITHTLGLLRSEVRDARAIASNIDQNLRAQRPNHPSPQALPHVLACHVFGRRKNCAAARIAADAYNNDPNLLKAAMAAPGLIGKSATAPAMTAARRIGCLRVILRVIALALICCAADCFSANTASALFIRPPATCLAASERQSGREGTRRLQRTEGDHRSG